VGISEIAPVTVDTVEPEAVEIQTNPADAELSAVVENDSIAEVSIESSLSGHVLTVWGQSEGTTTVTVTATKNGYRTSTRTFSVTVTEAELAEITIDPIETPSSLISGNNWECYVTTTPSDAVISAEVENDSIVQLSLEPELHKIYLTGQSEGTTNVTVTATKEGYLPGTRTFSVTVAEPLPALAQVEQPGWDGPVLYWADVDNAVSYLVKLYRGADSQREVVSLDEYGEVEPGVGNLNLSSYMVESGSYFATVTALGDGTSYNNGEESLDSPAYVVDNSGPPELVSVTATTPHSLEFVFNQPVFFVTNEDQFIGGLDSYEFSPSTSYDNAEINGNTVTYYYGGGGDGMELPCDISGTVTVAPGVVRNEAEEVNGLILEKPIIDGLGPALDRNLGAAVIAEDQIKLSFPEEVQFAEDESDFLSKVSIPDIDLTGATTIVSGDTITFTLAAPLEDLTYSTSALSIAAGALIDLNDNLSPAMENVEIDNFLPPYLVTNAEYGTVDGLSPAHGATGVPLDAKLILTFDRSAAPNEDVDIEIWKVGALEDTQKQTINTYSANWAGSGIFIFTPASLEANTQYYVVVPDNGYGIFGNDTVFFPGLDESSWSFTTGDTMLAH